MSHSLGIPDEQFIRGDIPMTKQEIRILTLAKASIGAADTVIDIGAGTGSLSIEAALLARQGRVYAIEREPEGIELIKANAAKFEAGNVQAVLGSAPAALAGLPAAEVILIGGSGGRLPDILSSADQLLKPGGRLIVTAVTVETLSAALQLMRQRPAYAVEACCVQVTRIQPVGTSNMFKALNPIYIITCTKEGQAAG
ncbi:precorrin-6Y C5,15-methyltransferase (decarboxylating) subunit CbiT [Sporomusa sphaeroides]|uniref:Cobalt-precorrin-6Y C(15)-methyltransferase [decarboxylating] n=1 Tax=Sporomusa sphaeroides DSM 2875 TaxID=1337886 RepID=A0ABP2C316_9FIRM|nr:precorrin-6Y C5,15-methyltransferase (decarboxylating) subunit CbiT [Sporomusa sphaeroides]OLS58044.1 putative cobalt-precorrin-6Y C(15)-methyltransferase [Sporomusa sphaeroides DSM 2875]CVK17769.1 putative cobalt-precorrin-6Y C(15)-methyltransferase [decarboxylating] [Sporomusa sphaeroides DSM 2875]